MVIVTFRIVVFQGKKIERKCFCSRCLCMEMVVAIIQLSGCNLGVTSKPLGSFDHVKRVEGWTTLTCHVYDSFYYKVMMIMICDMQFEDTEAQCVMWRNLYKMMSVMVFPIQISKDSWPIMFRPIGMLFELSMVAKMQVS